MNNRCHESVREWLSHHSSSWQWYPEQISSPTWSDSDVTSRTYGARVPVSQTWNQSSLWNRIQSLIPRSIVWTVVHESVCQEALPDTRIEKQFPVQSSFLRSIWIWRNTARGFWLCAISWLIHWFLAESVLVTVIVETFCLKECSIGQRWWDVVLCPSSSPGCRNPGRRSFLWCKTSRCCERTMGYVIVHTNFFS